MGRAAAVILALAPAAARAAGVTPIGGPAADVGFGSVRLDVTGQTSLGEYLGTAYQLGVIAVAALAVLVIAWGAVEVMSESFFKKADGRQRIWNAVLGLLLALGSVVILRTISASFETVNLSSLRALGQAVRGSEAAGSAAAGALTGIVGGGVGGAINRPIDANGDGVISAGEWAKVNTEREVLAWRRMYDSNLSYDQILAMGGVVNADGSYSLPARVTGYASGEANSDPHTDAGNGIFGALRTYSGPGTFGSAAVDSSIIPFGSIIRVNNGGGTQWYVAEDVGSAVINRQASGGSRPIVDVYSGGDGGTQNVSIYRYTGTKPWGQLSAGERQAYLDGLTIND
jgi:3D (Asp-Asp-Asp) domain-containing protein